MSKFLMAVAAALALNIGFGSLANAGEYKRAYCEETKQYCRFEKVVTYKVITDYKVETRYKTITDYRMETKYKTVTDYRTETKYKTVTEYKTITDYRMEKQAYTVYVTEYDDYNKPCKVKKTLYKTVKVPYQREVACDKQVPYEVQVPFEKQVAYEEQVPYERQVAYEVKVPCEKKVAVVKWVKVCD